MPARRRSRRSPALLLALLALTPSNLVGQIQLNFDERHCAQNFLSACATLQYVDFSNSGVNGTGVLTVIVSNTSVAADEPGAYIRKLYFDALIGLPAVDEFAVAQYGTISEGVFTPTAGETEVWKAKSEDGKEAKEISGFLKDLKLDDNAKAEDGGRSDLSVAVGGTVMLTITFQGAFAEAEGLRCMDTYECQGWTAEMKGLGSDEKGKGVTTTPEPSTWLLLGSGLLLLAFARRRRRSEFPPG